MKTCPICGEEIKRRTVIDGKVINTQRRKYCFECSPFGSGNNKALKCADIVAEKTAADARRKARTKANYRLYQKRQRAERKQKLVALFGGACVKCGYSRSIKALEFHHKNRRTKKFCISELGYTCSWVRLLAEAKKCQLLCANCHRELDYGRIT